MAEPKHYTMAKFARDVGVIARRLVCEQASLAEGMWNPSYCASNADYLAVALIEELESRIAHMKSRMLSPKQGVDA